MELDVCLTRSGDEPWGFRLIGGVDFHMPLTVVKVVPRSPADVAGLHNGDTVSSINGAEASTMSHQDSKVALAGAEGNLSLGVVRGLYDPVLDDFEPLYEPIDQEDFDQPSQPTEVPDYLDLTLTLPEYVNVFKAGDTDVLNSQLFKPLPDLVNGQKSESRSLTASPFVAPTKPYRPFSTEPLAEIPPLEEPIILNPSYQDEFGGLKDLEDFLPKRRFKLPISEQYDPDGSKQKMKGDISKTQDVTDKDFVTSVTESKTVKEEIIAKTDFDMKEQIMTKQEVKFMEGMNKEIDLDNIEKTATTIVDESIVKALTVAEEIKREMDIELSKSSDNESSKLKSDKMEKVTETISPTEELLAKFDLKEKAVKEVTKLVNLIDKTTEDIVQRNECREENIMSQVDQETSIDSKKSERKVSRTEKSISEEIVNNVSIRNEDIKESKNLDQKDVQCKVSVQDSKSNKIDLKENHKIEDSITETKYSTSKLLAEQRAYTIGLQTIPNIRGTIHSSYYYDLLLKTFFIHLTDVMVALSRFILAEPILSKSSEERQETRETMVSKAKETDYVDKHVKDIKTTAKHDAVSKTALKHDEISTAAVETAKDEVAHRVVTPAKKEKVVGKILLKAQEIKEQEKQQKTIVVEKKETLAKQYQNEVKHKDECHLTEEIVKKRELSGLKMAQLTEKKPEELMQNMEAVLTEFESKSSNEDIEIVRERRSRSRSRVDTPLSEMLQVDKSTQETTEVTSMTTSGISSSVSEFKTSRTSETGYKTTEHDTSDAKTYIAIVESHVYTNKDAIFDISKSTTVESAVETITKDTHNVSADKTIKSLETSEKAVQAVVDTSTKIIAAEKVDKIQSKEKSESSSKEILQNKQTVEEKVEEKPVAKVQDVIIQEITEPVVEYKSTFTQDYTVTEAKEEIEANKSEYVSQQKEEVTVIEQKAPIKEETVTFQNEVISISKQDLVAVKEEIVASKENFVAYKEESIPETAVITEVKKEETTALNEKNISVKKEVSDAKEVTAVKAEVTDVKKKVMVSESVNEDKMCDAVKKESSFVKEDYAIGEHHITEVVVKGNVKVEDALSVQTFTKEEFSVQQDVKEESVSDNLTSIAINEKDDTALLIEKDSSFVEVDKQKHISANKVQINEYESQSQFKHVESKHVEQESTFIAKSIDQESTFVAKSVEIKQFEQESTVKAKPVHHESTIITKSIADIKEGLKLPLCTDTSQKAFSPTYEEGDLLKTPTPCTVPPTPLTDEYIFTLVTKLPKREGTPIPRDCTPSDDDDEDPHIVKKGLVPHIEAKIEDQKIFDPPLPTPPTSPRSPTTPVFVKPGLGGGAPSSTRLPTSLKFPVYVKPGLRGGAPINSRVFKCPVYIKPGLKGGADRDYSQEEIKEIELKSSLLASAIDETIKSIEEYKEEVGIKKEVASEIKTEESVQNGDVIYNGYAKVVETKVFDTTILEKSSKQDTKTENEVIVSEKSINGDIKPQIKEMTNEFCERMFGATDFKTEPQSLESREMNGFHVASRVETESEENSSVDNLKNVVIGNGEMSNVNKITPAEKNHAVIVEDKRDPMEGYRPVPFDPEELNALREQRAALGVRVPQLTASQERELYKTSSGEIIGTHKGIVDGLDEAVVDAEIAKELGKPGITEAKIAELISGEAEMLREAHVMGVDFNKIKPIVESLKDSEVLKALNEELLRDAAERKKKEEKKNWTTFLQKPKRPVPRSKFGYYKDMEPEAEQVEVYKPKIVKQPKPKVAPDYKPKDFNTGLLPWEERALREPTPPPVAPEDPILIPEEAPEILEAVDPLPESEVPDLEDSGIPLPPPPEPKEATPPPEEEAEEPQELDLDAVLEETEKIIEENLVEEMEGGNIADQIMTSVQNMVDPNAPLDQQLAQMRAQLAALAQLPGVIQQSLELVTRQLSMLSQVESQKTPSIQEVTEADMTPAAVEETEVSDNGIATVEEVQPQEEPQPEPVEASAPTITAEELERMRHEEELMMEEQRKMEKQKKIEVWNEIWPWGNSKSYNRQYRVNFMKYEKPPVSLDHLKDSDVYKMIHNMEHVQPKRVEMLTPVVAECDYREKCRSMTPCPERLAQQVQP